MTLNNFLLQYENATSELLTTLRKVRDEIKVDINFKKKQATLDIYFTKALSRVIWIYYQEIINLCSKWVLYEPTKFIK